MTTKDKAKEHDPGRTLRTSADVAKLAAKVRKGDTSVAAEAADRLIELDQAANAANERAARAEAAHDQVQAQLAKIRV